MTVTKSAIVRPSFAFQGQIGERLFKNTRPLAAEGKGARVPLESRRYVDRSRIIIAGGVGGSGAVSFARQVVDYYVVHVIFVAL